MSKTTTAIAALALATVAVNPDSVALAGAKV